MAQEQLVSKALAIDAVYQYDYTYKQLLLKIVKNPTTKKRNQWF
jgi:hypothetical protein